MKLKIVKVLVLPIALLIAGTNSAAAQTFSPAFAADFGNSHPNYPPSNAIDGNTSFSSRWAATFDGGSANLFVDLGQVQRVDDVGIAFGRGDRRSYDFEIRARSGTSGSWTQVFRGQSDGRSSGIEMYNVSDISARQIRVKVFSNSAGTDWADVTEFEVYGVDGPGGNNTPTPAGSIVDVPGLVQAENFTNYSDEDSNNRGGAFRIDTGVDIQSCSDSGCGFNVGWMATGEWLEYSLDVDSRADYEAQIRVASRRNTGRISFEIDGSQAGNDQSINNTGAWQTWQTQRVSLGNIRAGRHTLRLNVEQGGYNINWINIVRVDDPEPPTVPPIATY